MEKFKIHTQTAQTHSPITVYPTAAVFFLCTCFSLLYSQAPNTVHSLLLAIRGTTTVNWLKEQFRNFETLCISLIFCAINNLKKWRNFGLCTEECNTEHRFAT